MKSIFEFDNYKAYLSEVESHRTSFQRGFRARLAEELGCKNAYVSHVLNNDANFSLEQGLKIAQYLELKDNEKKFLLVLIEFGRAGTVDLRKYLENEMGQLREQNLNIKDRLVKSATLTPEVQAVYYSHWMYAAIHVLTTLETHREISRLVNALRLPEEAIRSAVMFLLSSGILEEKNGRLHPGHVEVHLSKSSGQIRQHHTNWRMAAIESLVQIEKNDIHYSTISSLSFEEAEKLKAHFVKEIEQYVKRVQSCREETVFSFNLDFYSMIKK